MAEPEVEIKAVAVGPQKRISDSHRFALVVLGSMCCICTSFSFAFNLITVRMQELYHFSQRDISTVTTTGLCFQYFVIHYAFLFDYFGPTPVAVCCTIMLPLGTLLFALSFKEVIVGSMVVKLSVFNAFICGGCMVFDMVGCVTILAHFPSNRGPVIALLKTFTGLGSAIVGCLYAGFFNYNVVNYFFFLMAFSLVIGILSIAFMRLPEYHLTGFQQRRLKEEEKERRIARKAQYLKQRPQLRRFIHGFTCLITLIVFLPMQSALASYLHLGSRERIAFAAVTTFVMAMYLLVAAPLPWYRDIRQEQKELQHEEELLAATRGADNALEAEAEVEAGFAKEVEPYENTGASPEGDFLSEAGIEADARSGTNVSNIAPKGTAAPVETEVDFMAPQYQRSFLRNLLAPEMWCIFWTMFTVLGTELVIIFNANFVLAALSGAAPDSSLQALLTVLNGVGSAVGRLGMSFFEVWTQKRPAEDRIPITIALFPPTCSIILCLVLFLSLPKAALPLPYVVAALGNGFLAATAILVTHTIFAKDQAKNYNFLFLASLLAAILLVRFLYGEWSSVQTKKIYNTDSVVCLRRRCVVMPLCVCLGLCVSAFVSDIFAHLRYRAFSKRVLAERRRLRLVGAAEEGAADGDAETEGRGERGSGSADGGNAGDSAAASERASRN